MEGYVMQERKADVAKKVLDYWYTMEFLSQEKFPKWSESDKRKARIAENEENKRRNAVGKSDYLKFVENWLDN